MKDALGNEVYPVIRNGTTFLPIRAIAQAFGKSVDYDARTHTVYIGGISDEEESTTPKIKLYVDKVKVTPLDANGNEVRLFIENGTTYVPIRAIATALKKDIKWDDTARSIYITEKEAKPEVLAEKIEPGKFYKLRGYKTNLYASIQDNSNEQHKDIVMREDDGTLYQVWKAVDEGNGYVSFVSAASGLVIQVSGESKNHGHHCIVWPSGSGDTQDWYPEKQPDGTFTLRVKHSGMYMDWSFPNFVAQAVKNDSDSQKWEIIEYDM